MNAADFPRVGLQDAIARLAAMPALIEAALARRAPGDLLFRARDAEFSLVEHACHLRDLEREGYLVRVRRILAEDAPALAPFDGAAVASERDYPSQDARQAARDFAEARRALIALLAPLDARTLAREATFDGKRIMLCDLVAMICEHDRGHREEIDGLVKALQAR